MTLVMAEFSCGGVVLDNEKVLVVQTVNLRNKKVWTFPKGHIEPQETARQAALREVVEETGYRCRIMRPLLRVRYCFTLKDSFIKKTVQWYLMRKTFKAGKPDAAEIMDVRWVSFHKAREMLQYPSDKKLIDMVDSICRAETPRQYI